MIDTYYTRVVPRDLFNEASLLKCYGQLALNLERLNRSTVELCHNGEPFLVAQDTDDGSLLLVGVALWIGNRIVPMWRPLNSRRPYPLFAKLGNVEVDVFNDDGTFTAEMLTLLETRS